MPPLRISRILTSSHDTKVGGRASRREARRALIRMLPELSVRLTVLTFALVLLSAVMPPVITVLTGLFVSGVQRGKSVMPILAAFGVALIIGQSVGLARFAAADALGRRALIELGRRSMQAVLSPASIVHLEDPEWQDQISRARMTGIYGPRAAVRGLVEQWTSRLTGAASLLIVMRFSLLLAFALAGGAVISGSMLRRAYRRLVPATQGRAQEMRRAHYLSNLATSARPAKEIRVFGLANWTVERFRDAWLGPMRELWRQRRGASAVAPLSYLFLLAIQVVGLFSVTRVALRGEIDLGEAIIYLQAVIATLGMATVSDSDAHIEFGAATIPATIALEKSAAEDATVNLGGSTLPGEMPSSEIRFENVRFRYPGRDDDVFDGLNLTIPAGRSLGIVGENGAGKTTLIKLLARLYDPAEGRISVDGVDLRELKASAWQRRVAAIFQDFAAYPFSPVENIGFGAIEHMGDREALRFAANGVGLLEKIESLPLGWDTPLMRIFTGGVDLSGGEWQRLALARALFAARAGAGILVLDEPTAQMDVRGEAQFYERFLELTGGLTTILISHRFSTVRRADWIVVVADGKVVESGNHKDLVSAGGLYASMFELQAKSFREGK